MTSFAPAALHLQLPPTSQEVYAFKRATNYQREHNIWASDMAAEQRKESKYDTARAAGTGQRRNQGGEAFNIITLGSNTNSGGQAFAAKVSYLRSLNHSECLC